MLRNTIRFADALVNRLVTFVCLLLFLICLYATIDAANVYMNANDSSILKYKPELGTVVTPPPDLTEDFVAWITVDDSPLDYPIMQGETNYTYLNLDPYGNFSLSGSVFLDSRNSDDFSDPFSLVYGHHMEHDAMFGALDHFCEQDYFDQHNTGVLMTEEGSCAIDFFACCKTMTDNWLIFDPNSGTNQQLLSYLQKNAEIYEPEGKDLSGRILALSTCQGSGMERLVLFGTLQDLP